MYLCWIGQGAYPRPVFGTTMLKTRRRNDIRMSRESLRSCIHARLSIPEQVYGKPGVAGVEPEEAAEQGAADLTTLRSVCDAFHSCIPA